MTALAEAAKSRTPMVVLVPEATDRRAGVFVDLPSLAYAVGAEFHRVGPDTATDDAVGGGAPGHFRPRRHGRAGAAARRAGRPDDPRPCRGGRGLGGRRPRRG